MKGDERRVESWADQREGRIEGGRSGEGTGRGEGGERERKGLRRERGGEERQGKLFAFPLVAKDKISCKTNRAPH